MPMSRFLRFAVLSALSAVTGFAQNPAPDLSVNPAAQEIARPEGVPAIFIAGDSTAARNSDPDVQGWGVPFADYFDATKITIANRARGGRSSRTFITEGLWDKLLNEVRPGDIVLIQFGHNDGGAINEEPPGSTRPLRARGSLPGLGDEAVEIDNVLTKQPEVVHTFGWYIRKMIVDVRARDAVPVLLSLTGRNLWSDGKVERGNGAYRAWIRAIAQNEQVPFLDLTRMLADDYQARGEAGTQAFFTKDHTHTNPLGADHTAAAVVSGLRGLREGPKIDDWLSEQGRAVTADAIGWLNLPEPADPALPTLFLIGDSTVRNGRGDGANGEWGWGDYLAPWFDTTKLNIVNRAIGGLSSRTFLTQGHWQRVLHLLKPGDFVIMQFGHNDNGPLNDTSRARGTIKGTGDESEAIDNLLTGQPEVVHSYGWYLRHYIREAKAHGATPIVCSPVPRKKWADGKIVRNQAGYGTWAETVAREEGVPFIDLGERIAARYDELGRDAVDPLFADPHTHTSRAGAELNAEIVAQALSDTLGDAIERYRQP
ncbi:MAG: rhamnogalacturonan acetylesterase [Opitutaceae bacterium]|nr:rhamnogalacturonan acetylesterase [Opitutaceae bacterium]